MLERSLFFGIPLLGAGTGAVESLRSYVFRLAFEHGTKAQALLLLAIERLGWTGTLPALAEVLKLWNLHGGKELARRLVQLLERATGQGLQESTWADFAPLLAEQHLIRTGHGRYCPLCVQDEGAYGQLLWETACVSACPLHAVRLRDSNVCGAPDDALGRAQRPRLSHVCNSCGSIGFVCIKEEPEAASEGEVWAAKSVADLLATPRAVVSTWTDETVRRGLQALLNAMYGGSVVKAAQAAALGRGTVCTWLKGRARPNLRDLVKLCQTCDADVSKLMSGEFARRSSAHEGARPVAADPNLKRIYRARLVPLEVEQFLRDAASEVPPPSLRQFATLHGTYVEQLWSKWPELSKALVDARHAHARVDSDRRRTEAEQTYERAAQMLQASGLPITPKYLQQASDLVAFSRNTPRVEALMAVVARYRPAVAPK
jgi:hypothetical protein